MKKLIKTMAIALACTACVANFAGCGGKEKGDNVLSIAYKMDRAEIGLIGKLEAAFKTKIKEETGKDIKFDLYEVTDAGYTGEILRMSAAQELPDVLYITDQNTENFAKLGILENLDPYFDKDNFDFSAYDETVFEIAKTYDRKDEKHIYFAPRTYDQPVIYVNLEMYREMLGEDAVVPVADENWTWSALEKLCQDLRVAIDAKKKNTKDQYFPMEMNISWQPIYNGFVRSFGGYVYNGETGEIGFTQENTKKAMQKLTDWVDNFYIPKTAGNSLYLNGKAVLYVMSRPSLATMESEYDISDIAILPLPIYDSAFTGLENGTSYYSYGSVGYAMSKNSKNKDLAWKFMQFIMSEEGQELISSSGMNIPIIKSMQTDENATWKTCLDYLKDVDQSAFDFTDYKKDHYVRIPATFARTKGKDKRYELTVYANVSTVMGSLNNYDSVDAFCSYGQRSIREAIGQ